jgi:hypothetical protein
MSVQSAFGTRERDDVRAGVIDSGGASDSTDALVTSEMHILSSDIPIQAIF